jgi:Uma2 family endonuclease
MSKPTYRLHRWSRNEYDRMVETGVFSPEARLELLDGEIVEMSPQKSLHASAVDLVEEVLRGGFGEGFYVRGQKPLTLDDYSEPEPDVAVVKGTIRDYAKFQQRGITRTKVARSAPDPPFPFGGGRSVGNVICSFR